MKKLITSMLLCLLMPCITKADDIKTFDFPKEKGVLMYGATMKDELGPLHYVSFFSNEGKVTKLGRIDEEDNGTHMRNLRCGTFCGDKYYGYLVNVYSYVEEPKAFGTVDFNNGTFTVIRDGYDKTERVSWPTLYEMTYDNTNKICYALGRNTDGLFVSDLYKIDLTTGDYEMLATLDFYAWAMACDYEGNIYMIKGIPDKKGEFYEASAIVRIDADDNYAEKDERRIKVDDKDFIPNYTHTMEFDHDTNHLHWMGMSNDGWQKAFLLDINTGKAVQTADMLYNMVAGLYIPFRGADNRMAAGMVTGLKGSPAGDGSMKAAIEWVNPVNNWKGDALESLASVSVARDNENNILTVMDAGGAMGEKMEYEDMAAQKGYNVYYITTYRKEGEKGMTDSVRVFVGPDVPGRPQNVTVTAEGKNIRIDWQAPQTGAHGENYDIASTVYEITRMPDNEVIATDIAVTTFTDDKIGQRKQYSYMVKAMNAEGEGLSEESAPITAGSAYTLPFKENFDNEMCTKTWTAVDANADGSTFEWAGGGAEDFCRYQVWLNGQYDTDDYIITPPLATKKGVTYRVNCDIQLGRMEDIHKFVLTTGAAPTAEGQTNRVDSMDNLKCESYNQIINYEAKFTADADETYVGINCMSYVSETGSYFAVRNFGIEEIFARDMAVKALTGAKELVKDAATETVVTVKNMGAETVNAYRTEVITRDADGNVTVIGATDVDKALDPDACADVKVMVTAVTEGKMEIAARVIVEGDMNDGNDCSAWNECNVSPAGTTDWNIIVEGGNAGQSTTEPMNFYNEYSTVENIYLKDEIKAEKDGKITRIAYQYSDNGIGAETKECDVKIYMANTDRSEYGATATAADWMPLEESVMVCEKRVKIIPGTDNMMVFDLDTAFDYDHTKNLCVQVWKEGALDEMFPALFKTYDFGWEVYRGLRYNYNYMPFDFEDSDNFFPINNIPVLHIAMDFDNESGIFEVDGGKRLMYRDGVLTLQNGMISAVTVTDITGKIILSKHADAAEIGMNLNEGLYIIKAVDSEGSTHILKVIR